MGVLSHDRLRAKLKGEQTMVRVLLAHPMDTGRAKDKSGHIIPAKFIQEIECWRNDRSVLTIECGTATARNPYFSFYLKGGERGDRIRLRWVDNQGNKGEVETQVQ